MSCRIPLATGRDIDFTSGQKIFWRKVEPCLLDNYLQFFDAFRWKILRVNVVATCMSEVPRMSS